MDLRFCQCTGWHFQVELIKYTDKELKELGLKKEIRDIIMYIQENGSISNSEVQNICDLSKATATRYLGQLEGEWIKKIGTTGVGTTYVFKGLGKGSNIITQTLVLIVLLCISGACSFCEGLTKGLKKVGKRAHVKLPKYRL